MTPGEIAAFKAGQLAMRTRAAAPLDEVGLEIEDALVSEGIYMWGPDGERFERMFEVVMKQRRALPIEEPSNA